MNRTSPQTNAPLVSVGIPTYNRPEGLRRTLDCILAQTYGALEIIISDNASPGDAVAQVCQEYADRDSRVRYVRQTDGLGIAGNFQFVLGAATGIYFMWAADDDEWEPRFIETCVGQLEQGAIVAMTASSLHLRYTGERLHPVVPYLSLGMSRYETARAFLMRPYPSMMYGVHRRKEILACLDDLRWFDFYDCYFVFKLLLRGPAVVLPEALFVAGVDAPWYVIKPMDKTLRFAPFFTAVMAALDAADLSVAERWWLKAVALLTTARLMMSYARSRLAAVAANRRDGVHPVR